MEKLTEEQITEIINEHVVRGSTLYSVQYHDYDTDAWTVPVLLTEKRAEQILKDNSIRAVKLLFGNTMLILVL